MERLQKRLAISNHHGDTQKPNTLNRAKKIAKRYNHEIDIYEVDFISSHGRIISSHDYNIAMIKKGSPLEEWIDYFVVRRRKMLWLDIKENLPIFMACGYEKFDVDALFHALESKRLLVQREAHLDIAQHIIIGCQESEVHEEIWQRNSVLGHRWQLILDAPNVWSYVVQYITPWFLKPYLRNYVCNEFRCMDYRQYEWISVDQSFFEDSDDIEQFVQSLELRPGVKIILNSYDHSVEPIEIPGHYVIMQYDYTLEK